LERTFTFSNGARSLYSYWKEKIQPNHWQRQIDRLADEKISWDQFFESSSIFDHPALPFSTSKGEQSLLHLAVYQNREEWVSKLSNFLYDRRNSYGLTALEIAKFLGRKKCVDLLQTSLRGGLSNAPNVLVENPEKLTDLQDFEYLDEPMFESAGGLDLILEKTALAKSRDQIPGEKIWMGIYFNKEVQKGLHPKVSLKWIDEKLGFGIFAAQRIQSCTFIGEYTGIIRETAAKDNYYCVRYTTWDVMRRKFIIDAQHAGNFTRFINHSDRPNLGLQSIYWCGLPRMVLVSLQEIEEGAQLTFDYGNLFWKECPHTPIPIG